MAAAEKATSGGSIGSKHGAQSSSGRGSGRGLWKATGPRLNVGPRLTGLGRKCLVCRPAQLDLGSSLGWFN